MSANKTLTLEECIDAFANLLDGEAAYCDGHVSPALSRFRKALKAAP